MHLVTFCSALAFDTLTGFELSRAPGFEVFSKCIYGTEKLSRVWSRGLLGAVARDRTAIADIDVDGVIAVGGD